MPSETQVVRTTGRPSRGASPLAEPCLLVIFGASGDLTKRLLMPALYNLACDGLLPDRFAIIGIAMDEMTTDQFRARMTQDIQKFSTRKAFDEKVWGNFVERLHYTPGKFDDPRAYQRLAEVVGGLDAEL